MAYNKERENKRINNLSKKLTTADNFKVLLSLKEYTKLNQQKRKLWLDYNSTLKEIKTEGIFDIFDVIKQREQADELIKDYYKTAKSKEKSYSSNWNNLDYDQQQKLISKWAREKLRKEKLIESCLMIDEDKLNEKKREIELAKFHEQKGIESCLKGNNPCYSCENKKQIQQELIQERKKIMSDYEEKQQEVAKIEWVETECNNCGEWKKKVNSDSGLCKTCDKELNFD